MSVALIPNLHSSTQTLMKEPGTGFLRFPFHLAQQSLDTMDSMGVQDSGVQDSLPGFNGCPRFIMGVQDSADGFNGCPRFHLTSQDSLQDSPGFNGCPRFFQDSPRFTQDSRFLHNGCPRFPSKIAQPRFPKIPKIPLLSRWGLLQRKMTVSDSRRNHGAHSAHR